MTFRTDILFAAIPELRTELDGNPEEVARRLQRAASDFLEAGGTVSLVEWSTLSEGSRAALTLAGRKIREEAIALLAAAMHNPIVGQALSEGAEPEDIELRGALEAAAAKAAGEEAP